MVGHGLCYFFAFGYGRHCHCHRSAWSRSRGLQSLGLGLGLLKGGAGWRARAQVEVRPSLRRQDFQPFGNSQNMSPGVRNAFQRAAVLAISGHSADAAAADGRLPREPVRHVPATLASCRRRTSALVHLPAQASLQATGKQHSSGR